jgi:hypothetical protein
MEGSVYCMRLEDFFISVRVAPFLGCKGVTETDKSWLLRAKNKIRKRKKKERKKERHPSFVVLS